MGREISCADLKWIWMQVQGKELPGKGCSFGGLGSRKGAVSQASAPTLGYAIVRYPSRLVKSSTECICAVPRSTSATVRLEPSLSYPEVASKLHSSTPLIDIFLPNSSIIISDFVQTTTPMTARSSRAPIQQYDHVSVDATKLESRNHFHSRRSTTGHRRRFPRMASSNTADTRPRFLRAEQYMVTSRHKSLGLHKTKTIIREEHLA